MKKLAKENLLPLVHGSSICCLLRDSVSVKQLRLFALYLSLAFDSADASDGQ